MSSLVREHRILLFASIFFSALSSLAFPFMIVVAKSDAEWGALPISLLFWLGLIGEQAFFWGANFQLKKIIPAVRVTTKPRIGIAAIFKTTAGAVADLVFAVSLLMFLIFVLFNIGGETFQYIILFFLVLSFRLHCILNGKNFWYSNLLARRDRKNG